MRPTPTLDRCSRAEILALRQALAQPGLRTIFAEEQVSLRELEARRLAVGIEGLVRAGLLEDHGASLRLPFQYRWIDGLLIFSDRVTREWKRDPYRLDPLWEGPGLSRLLLRRPVRRALDMGCGCGVLALSAATHAERVTAVDVNPRALSMSRGNARLNGIDNVDFVASDLFDALGPQRFDHVVSNFPGYFALETRSMIGAGERLMARFFSELPARLGPGGCAQVNVAGLERRNASFLDLLGDWMGADRDDLGIVMLEWFRVSARAPRRLPVMLWRALVDGIALLRVTELFRGWMTLRRGGRGAFRVPLSYHEQLAPLGRDFGGALIAWLLDDAARLVARGRDGEEPARGRPDRMLGLPFGEERRATEVIAEILAQLEAMPSRRGR